MNNKRMKATTLAAILALSVSAPALAAGPGTIANNANANADTTISIFSTSSSQANMSYTIPLYVTMAVANMDTDVKVPTNYDIVNTTAVDDKGKQPSIGVTQMSFEKLSTSGYNTVVGAPATANDIQLTIGGETMPALSTQGAADPWAPKGAVLVENGAPKKIIGTQNLAIKGTVTAAARSDLPTAAQFRLKYTVSLIDASGHALGAVYAGDDRTAAGLK